MGTGTEVGVAFEVGLDPDEKAPDAGRGSDGVAAPGAEAAMLGEGGGGAGGGDAALGTGPAPLFSGSAVVTGVTAEPVAAVTIVPCPSRAIKLSSEPFASWM